MKAAALALLLVFITACETIPTVVETVTVNEDSTELVTKSTVLGKDIKVYILPLDIPEPMDATLAINFKIRDAGHCQTSYEPTVFYLNEHLVSEFDFRRYFLKKTISRNVHLKKNLFKKGRNILKIETGYCQYDIDVLKLNSLKLISTSN